MSSDILDRKTLENHLEIVKSFVVEKGVYVLDHWDDMVVNKINDRRTDVSTNFDEEIERDFADLVIKNFPEHGFVGEEVKDLDREGDLKWHIDPIDGTKYFAKGVPLWCVTLALVYKGEPLLGIVYNPPAKQIHYAVKGGGAFLNGQKIKVNDHLELENMQIAYDFPVMDKLIQRYEELEEKDLSWEDFRAKIIDREAELRKKAYRVRDLGSGAYSLVWVAQGVYSGYVIPAQPIEKFVDIAAGLLIAQEAGANVYRNNLSPNLYQLIVGNSKDTVKQLKFAIKP